jgi:hypothetical protein
VLPLANELGENELKSIIAVSAGIAGILATVATAIANATRVSA